MTETTEDHGLGPALTWIAERMEGFDPAAYTAEKITGGQSNPTYRLIGPRRFVLRRKPPGKLLKSAHAVDREYRVQSALQDTPVPTATMRLLCEDDSVIGAAFYLMDEVAGRNLTDPCLPDIAVPDRAAYQAEMARVMAAIHNVDPAAVGLADYAPPGNYMARQIARWTRQYEASKTDDLPDMDALMTQLAAQEFDDDAPRHLVHGDYRIDNMIFAPEGATCAAVLDWELSTLGDPFADLAALLMQWQMPPGKLGRGLAGVNRAKEGLMTDEAFTEAYCQHRGIAEVPRMNVYMGFAFFRMASILQGVKKRALDGNASDPASAQLISQAIPAYASLGLAALNAG